MTISNHGGTISLVYQCILQLLHPKLEEADLLILVAPHRSTLIPQRIPGASRSGLHARLAILVYTVMLLAVPFWLIYALWVLFRRFELTDFTVWAALVLSILFVVLGGTVLASPLGKRRAVD